MVERAKPYCRVCNGIEGSTLATECPGSPLTGEHVNRLYRGEIDFRGGEWVDLRADAAPTQPAWPADNPGASTYHKKVEVELPADPEEEEPAHTTETHYVPVPVPIPIPIPLAGGGTDTPPASVDADPLLDINVTRR